MKRFSSFLLIFLLTAVLSYTESIIYDVEQFSKLFPAVEGSAEEKQTLAIISERLTELNLDFSETGFSETEGYHSYSSYIEVDIPGPAIDTLITIIPVSSSYGISTALHLLEYFNSNAPPLNLKFIFLGAEHSGGQNLGSRNFLEHFFPEAPNVFIYLNLTGIPTSVTIHSGTDGYSSPNFLFKTIRESLYSAGIENFHSETESILFRLASTGYSSMIDGYLKDGYPAIELSTLGVAGPDYNGMINYEHWEQFYNAVIDSFSMGIPDEWDSHYIFGLDERSVLIIYIILLSALMIYPVFKRRNFGWYMKTLKNNFWSLPLLFGFIFVFMALTSSLISFIFAQKGFPELWKYLPLSVFSFKIVSSLLIYSLSFKLISKLPFSEKGSFYSISALFFLLISLFILTVINLSLSLFTLWSLLFIFLLTVFKRPIIKLLMLLLSMLWLFLGLYEIFTLPSYRVIELLTLSPLQGNLLISVVIMPFILAAIRIAMMTHLSRKITRLLPAFLSSISAALLVLILFYSPFSESNPQPVNIIETIDSSSGKSNINIESPDELSPETSKLIVLETDQTDRAFGKIDYKLETESFLNRKITRTIVDFPEQPEKLSLTLYSDETLTLYESNYPAQWLPAQKRLEVFIGNNPPLPLEISLTLNKNASAVYTIEAEFPVESSREIINGNHYIVSRRTKILKNYSDEE
ncbi:MAG: hypothetical protein PQJ61_13830 [Spirochaetales bacterium]|uniref:Uncharacterized protein n=1 Tax=Candidatus Thalassospirochaeta sargassi TaxID=3119039 RepID=A0AAJ1MNJ7_9SPIO|nr:hypothetical protein [Spirochaetales bacterium]